MNEKVFYDEIRKSKIFGASFDSKEFEGVREILKDTTAAGWPLSYTAYALATAFHETAGTMQPIKEYGGRSYFMRMYDVSGERPKLARQNGNTSIGDGAVYFGRGYVQLTWKNNYKFAGEQLKIDLVNNPDLALNPDIASDIMIRGMQEGWFTRLKLSDFLPARGTANLSRFKSARRIINGTDKDKLIAEYAIIFQNALLKAST